MGSQPEQMNFTQVYKRPVLKDYERSGGQQWGPRPFVPGGEDMMTGFYPQQETAAMAQQVMGLPTARTVTMYMKGFHDCTDWYLTDPTGDPNNFNHQVTRFVAWDGVLYDRQNNDKTTGIATAIPVLKAGTALSDRVAVTAPAERPVTVVVSWGVLPYADINPDGPGGEVGSGTSLGASGQIMWASVGGPDKGLFGTGPLAISLVGVAGINAIAWPTGAHAALVVPPSSTYEIGLNFVAGIDTSYFNGVGRESQVVRTRLLGNFESFGAQFGVTGGIPPTYFNNFSLFPEVGPAKFENDSFSMMTVTTY